MLDGAVDRVIRCTHVVQDPGERGFLDTLAHEHGRKSIVWGFPLPENRRRMTGMDASWKTDVSEELYPIA